MRQFLAVLITTIALAGCGDDNTFISPVTGGNPAKCIGDPCLPGCEADKHGFVCPPEVPEPEDECSRLNIRCRGWGE